MNANKACWQECERKSKPCALGRRLSRRLSLVAKVPAIINAKLKHEISHGGQDLFPDLKHFEVTVIAPDKTQRIVSARNIVLLHLEKCVEQTVLIRTSIADESNEVISTQCPCIKLE